MGGLEYNGIVIGRDDGIGPREIGTDGLEAEGDGVGGLEYNGSVIGRNDGILVLGFCNWVVGISVGQVDSRIGLGPEVLGLDGIGPGVVETDGLGPEGDGLEGLGPEGGPEGF